NRVDGVRGQKFVTQAGDVESDKKTGDRKSTRLNSSHTSISYAVFCVKKETRAQLAREETRRARVSPHGMPVPRAGGACRQVHHRRRCLFLTHGPAPGIYPLPLHAALRI